MLCGSGGIPAWAACIAACWACCELRPRCRPRSARSAWAWSWPASSGCWGRAPRCAAGRAGCRCWRRSDHRACRSSPISGHCRPSQNSMFSRIRRKLVLPVRLGALDAVLPAVDQLAPRVVRGRAGPRLTELLVLTGELAHASGPIPWTGRGIHAGWSHTRRCPHHAGRSPGPMAGQHRSSQRASRSEQPEPEHQAPRCQAKALCAHGVGSRCAAPEEGQQATVTMKMMNRI